MPITIPNTTLLDAYDPSTTFGGNLGQIKWGFFTVANASVFVRLLEGEFGMAHPQDEVFCPPATYPIITGGKPISGIQARNAIAGQPAQFFGSMFFPGEPGIQAGTPFTGTISPSGGVSQGGTVNVLKSGPVTVSGSAAENQVAQLVIPGNSLGVNSAVLFTMLSDLLNSTGVNRTFIVRIKINGVNVWGTISSAIATNAVRHASFLQWGFANIGATNQNALVGAGLASLSAAGSVAGIGSNWGYGTNADTIPQAFAASNPLAVDTTADVTVSVTIQPSVAAAGLEWRTFSTIGLVCV